MQVLTGLLLVLVSGTLSLATPAEKPNYCPDQPAQGRSPASEKPKRKTRKVPAAAQAESRKARDEKLNRHIIDTYKKSELEKTRIETDNRATKKPLRESTTYKEPSEKFLYMDQEIVDIPDRDDTFRYEPNYLKTPDASVEKDLKEDQNVGKTVYRENFDENTFREETFTIKNQKRKPNSKKSGH